MIKNSLSIKELAQILSVSKSKATSIVRELNQELEAEGYIAIRGKVPIQLAREKFPYHNISDEVLKELDETD